jgi:hypothetical protein
MVPPGDHIWVRTSRASRPPKTRKKSAVTMYSVPMSLWLVVTSQRLTDDFGGRP